MSETAKHDLQLHKGLIRLEFVILRLSPICIWAILEILKDILPFIIHFFPTLAPNPFNVKRLNCGYNIVSIRIFILESPLDSNMCIIIVILIFYLSCYREPNNIFFESLFFSKKVVSINAIYRIAIVSTIPPPKPTTST